ncbi:cation diffusion facilitator family transporter [Emcibacter sp. SYSU 3D8]|uniref:cation diffusion facilitator family transporter n=1 Tax=Emcibacter sp. SYSU 3D8 TaxID=3133969 RepID=UPI0031FE6C68
MSAPNHSELDRAAIDIRRAAPLMKRAARASLTVAALLIGIKFAAGLYTGSVAILSSLVDSLLDMIASAVNLFAIAQAVTPADRQHRFGHGKAESIGSLVQAAVMAGSAAFVIFEAASRLLAPPQVRNPEAGIAVMVVSIGATLALVLYQQHVVRKTGSTAVLADSRHYISDLLTNLSVIAALIIAGYTGFAYADPLFAIGIALYLAWSAYSIVRVSFDVLMDKELPDIDRDTIKDMVRGHPGVISLHDLRTRSSGPNVFIQFHVEVDRTLSLLDAHEIVDDIEGELLERYPGAEVIIHADPQGVIERRDHFER